MANFWVISDQGMIALVNALRQSIAGGYLNGLTLRLYSNDFSPAHNTPNAGFTECNFSGYAAQATNNWGPPVNNGLNEHTDTTDMVHTFNHNGGPQANTIYGVYLTDAAGNWILAQRTNVVPPPVMSSAANQYQFQPRLTGATYSAYP
jgi:hypothetical protein